MKNADETKDATGSGAVWFEGSFDRLIATLRDDGRCGNEKSIEIAIRDVAATAQLESSTSDAMPGSTGAPLESLHVTRRQAAALRDALNDWARANGID